MSTIQVPSSVVASLSPEGFAVLAYLMTEQPRKTKAMGKTLGISRDRVLGALGELKKKEYLIGHSTQIERGVELTATARVADHGDVMCEIPSWLVLNFKSLLAAKQLIAYYFREGGVVFDGSVADLAEAVGQKKRNANYLINQAATKKIVTRTREGHKLKLAIAKEAPIGIFSALFGT